MNLYAGTSGFSYKEWKGSFYPEDLAAADMLRFYAGRLPAVEINNTFYRLPKESMLAGWAAQVPPAFRFALKASQRITHMKRLRGAEGETEVLMQVAGALGPTLGPILFQLPPNLKVDVARLAAFLELLPPGARAAFEFRHPSWAASEVHEVLAARRCALCVADVDEEPEPEISRTADWGYLRLRRQDYPAAALTRWLERIRDQGWESAYVFFKHEDAGAGPRLAGQFLGLASPPAVGEEVPG
jgi:uncharacterized protein YecE (DUF72 family)